jgi:protein TonB
MMTTRFILGVPLAAAITFGLFIFMRGLIAEGEAIEIDDFESIDPITIYYEPTEEPPIIERPVEKPPEIEPLDLVKYVASEPSDDTGLIIEYPVLGELIDPIGIENCGQPIVRVPPSYPSRAAEKAIEGYVVVRFTVTKLGSVTNVHIVEAEPVSVFDKAAIKAVRKWKYNPCKRGGQVDEVNLEVVLSFELD